jgi:hypothetical protein
MNEIGRAAHLDEAGLQMSSIVLNRGRKVYGIGRIHIVIVSYLAARRVVNIISAPAAIVAERSYREVVVLPWIGFASGSEGR